MRRWRCLRLKRFQREKAKRTKTLPGGKIQMDRVFQLVVQARREPQGPLNRFLERNGDLLEHVVDHLDSVDAAELEWLFRVLPAGSPLLDQRIGTRRIHLKALPRSLRYKHQEWVDQFLIKAVADRRYPISYALEICSLKSFTAICETLDEDDEPFLTLSKLSLVRSVRWLEWARARRFEYSIRPGAVFAARSRREHTLIMSRMDHVGQWIARFLLEPGADWHPVGLRLTWDGDLYAEEVEKLPVGGRYQRAQERFLRRRKRRQKPLLLVDEDE